MMGMPFHSFREEVTDQCGHSPHFHVNGPLLGECGAALLTEPGAMTLASGGRVMATPSSRCRPCACLDITLTVNAPTRATSRYGSVLLLPPGKRLKRKCKLLKVSVRPTQAATCEVNRCTSQPLPTVTCVTLPTDYPPARSPQVRARNAR
jgi:hypothetical protein